MMTAKTNRQLISLWFVVGVAMWCVDGVIDAVFFQEGTILHSLFLIGASAHEIYVRTFFVASFLVFGVVLIKALSCLRKSDQTRRETEERLRTLLQTIPDAIFFKDSLGRHLVVNKAAEKMLSLTEEDILGKTVEAFMTPEGAAACRLSDDEAIAARKPTQSEETFQNAGGEMATFETIKSPLYDEQGMAAGLVCMLHDITERKRMEEELFSHREHLMHLVDERTAELKQEIVKREAMEESLLRSQKLESLGVLAGGIAHDFNNLLAAIVGNVSLARLDAPQGSELDQHLAHAERASARAQDLTTQLLTFSRGGNPVKRMIAIGEVISEAAQFSLRGARHRCTVDAPGDLWQVDADSGQISQVINNLVINAEQAMPDGGTIGVKAGNAVIEADTRLPLPPGRYVRITVEDRGIGIAKGHLERIFDPYFTTKQKGSGLGLAVTYSIVKKHSGHISAASDPDKGTVFTVYLPAFASSAAPAAQTAKGKIVQGRGRVLIMEDEAMVREAMEGMLGRLGYTLALTVNGAEAVQCYQDAMAKGTPFDVVIMDLTVPGGMGGVETMAALQKIDPGVRAIVSSGYSGDDVMANYRKYGFQGFAVKPYSISALSTVIASVMAGGEAGKTPD